VSYHRGADAKQLFYVRSLADIMAEMPGEYKCTNRFMLLFQAA